jgi:hypothetical protein
MQRIAIEHRLIKITANQLLSVIYLRIGIGKTALSRPLYWAVTCMTQHDTGDPGVIHGTGRNPVDFTLLLALVLSQGCNWVYGWHRDLRISPVEDDLDVISITFSAEDSRPSLQRTRLLISFQWFRVPRYDAQPIPKDYMILRLYYTTHHLFSVA